MRVDPEMLPYSKTIAPFARDWPALNDMLVFSGGVRRSAGRTRDRRPALGSPEAHELPLSARAPAHADGKTSLCMDPYLD
jgi:hypothetical protein